MSQNKKITLLKSFFILLKEILKTIINHTSISKWLSPSSTTSFGWLVFPISGFILSFSHAFFFFGDSNEAKSYRPKNIRYKTTHCSYRIKIKIIYHVKYNFSAEITEIFF